MDQRGLSANFEKSEDSQLAHVLTTLIWASLGIYLFVIITALFYHDWVLISVTLAGCALLIVPVVLLKRRKLHASSLVIMLIELVTATIIATEGQGIRDLAMVVFPILFIFAGLALERPYFILCIALTLLAVCWLAFGEAFGWFVTKPFQGNLTSWFYLIGMIIILLVAALAVDLLATRLHTSLGQAQTEVMQRKRAEEQILQLNASLEQRVADRTHELRAAQEKLVRHEKLAVLGQIAGSVGHELRNPLGVINSAIYYLKLVQPDADENIKKHLGIVEQEVHNADKIITDLLDFARIKGVNQEQVSVDKLVHSTLERFPIPAGIEVALVLPDDLPLVYADPRQIEQVLGNLVTNACQAMPDAGKSSPAGTLSVTSDLLTGDGEQWVRIHVKDTGTGISPENLKKLFEPLFTTKPTGIGLGLAVSLKLAEANQGKIEVESEMGKGSTFTLVLPVKSL